MKGFLTENIGLKMFSLLLAVMLELYLNSPDKWVTVALNIPVEIRNLSQDMIVVEPVIGRSRLFAKVKFQGPKSQVKQVESFAPSLFVDLPIPNPDSFRAELNEKQLRLPSHVEVLEIDPTFFDMKLDRVKAKELLVTLETNGQLALGYMIENIEIRPVSVIVRGPSREVNGLVAVEGRTVDVKGLSRSKRFEVPLIVKGLNTRYNVDVVSVNVKVSPIVAQKTFRSVTVKVIAPKGFAATVSPSSATVTLGGPQSVLTSLKPSDVTLMANGKHLETGNHMVRLKGGRLPKDVKVVHTDPAKVSVTLYRSPAKEPTEKEQRKETQ